MKWSQHILLALALSYGLSLVFWLGFGVFVLTGFILVSLGCAVAGVVVSALTGGRLWVTAVVTVIVRCLAFYLATTA